MPCPSRLAIYFLFTLLAACYGHIENREEVIKGMNAMEIKRVTDTQLEQWVRYQGDKMSRVGQKTLNRAWIAMQTDSSSQKVSLDSLMHMSIPVLDSLAEAHHVTIFKLSFEDRLEIADSLAKPAMEQLQKYRDKQIALGPQAQILDNPQTVLYTSPIILNAEAQGMWSIYFDRTQTIRDMDMDEFEDVILKN